MLETFGLVLQQHYNYQTSSEKKSKLDEYLLTAMGDHGAAWVVAGYGCVDCEGRAVSGFDSAGG